MGLLLRRPFQGLSHFDLPETLSCWAFTYIQNGREVALDIKTNGLSKQGFLFFREKILPVIDDIQNFRLHVGFLKQEEVPHHLGTSKAYRWNKNSKGLGCSIVIEQGHLLGMPWLLSMTDSMRFDLWTAKKSDSEDQKNAHETESEPSSRATSPTPSEMARVEDVLEGTSTNFSDLRSVLQCPEAVERTVGQELWTQSRKLWTSIKNLELWTSIKQSKLIPCPLAFRRNVGCPGSRKTWFWQMDDHCAEDWWKALGLVVPSPNRSKLAFHCGSPCSLCKCLRERIRDCEAIEVHPKRAGPVQESTWKWAELRKHEFAATMLHSQECRPFDTHEYSIVSSTVQCPRQSLPANLANDF